MGLSHPLNWWITNNPILLAGQEGYITDLGLFKIGDGVNTYSLLSFQGQPLVVNWFAQFKPISNVGSSLSTAYNNCFYGGSFVQQGNWLNFKYIVQTASNGNSKSVFLKFANQTIFSKTWTGNNVIVQLEGEIVCIDYTNKTVSYKITYLDNSNNISYSYGTLTGIDFTQNHDLLLQLTGIASNDLTALEGKGVFCPIGLPNQIF